LSKPDDACLSGEKQRSRGLDVGGSVARKQKRFAPSHLLARVHSLTVGTHMHPVCHLMKELAQLHPQAAPDLGAVVSRGPAANF
jgi:hypothetical protein